MEWLYDIDVAVFRVVNTGIANPIGDIVFPFLSEIRNFYVPYLLGLLFIIYRFRWKGVAIVGLLILCIVISDQFASSVVKPLVGRIRPCSALADVRTLMGCGPGKSFPSSHAVNTFAGVFILAHFFRKGAPWFYAYAALVAISRVYVGVHYPSDVLAGAAIGMGIGWVLVAVYKSRARIGTTLRGAFTFKQRNP